MEGPDDVTSVSTESTWLLNPADDWQSARNDTYELNTPAAAAAAAADGLFRGFLGSNSPYTTPGVRAIEIVPFIQSERTWPRKFNPDDIDRSTLFIRFNANPFAKLIREQLCAKISCTEFTCLGCKRMRRNVRLQAALVALVLGSIIVGTVIGNILVCVAVFLVKKLRKPCNYLLVSLAVSDLCVALLVMPISMLYELRGSWAFGSTLCEVWVSFDVLSCTASILNLCMISVDR